jgi:hypothetical protein
MAEVIGPSIVRTPSDPASRCDAHEKYRRPFIGLRQLAVRLTPRIEGMAELGASEPSQDSTPLQRLLQHRH